MHVLLARNPDLKKSVKDTRAAIRQRKREFDRLALGYLS